MITIIKNREDYNNDAKRFYGDFIKNLKDNQVKFDENTYKNSKKWTELISSNSNSIINETFKSFMGLSKPNTNREYFRIDNILWSRPSYTFHSPLYNVKNTTEKLNTHIWNLLVTVEHENNRNDWTDEITKLMYIRSELRIVIGYSSTFDQKEEIIAANELLSYYKNFIRPEEGSFMLVLGSRTADVEKQKGSNEKEKIVNGFKAYIWNGEKLEEYKEIQ